jgi:AbrB family looped-hinge helix DNA binding protein
MKQMTIPIDQAGRLVLPKNVREELAIKPGDRFSVSVQGMSVMLTAQTETGGFVRKGKALVFSSPSEEQLTDAEVNALLEESRAEREGAAFGASARRKNRK